MNDGDPDLEALLGGLPAFETLPAEEIILARPHLSRKRVSEGDYLLRQGETQPELVYCLLTATAEILVGPPERERLVSLAQKGQWLGFLTMFSNEPYPVSVRISQAGEVAAIPTRLLRELAEKYPAIGRTLAADMAHSLQEVLEDILPESSGAALLHHAETFPFRRRVRDAMTGTFLSLPPATTAHRAAAAMRENGAGALVVVEGEYPVGIVTEQDMVFRVLATAQDGAGKTLGEIMSSPIHSIAPDEYLYKAMGFMSTKRILFLPVMEGGRVVGLLSIRDILALATKDTLALVENIETADSIEMLKDIRSRRRGICLSLLDDNVPATEVSQILSSVNRDLHRRTLEICLAQMSSEGKGDPPAPFCLIVMGSHGRGENHFRTDQDHGLIIGDVQSERRALVEAYFAELGSRLSEGLREIGFPLCTGGVMSSNRQWRKPLAEWQQEVDRWLTDVDPVTVRRTTVFYDFVPLWGDVALASRLRAQLTSRVKGNVRLIRALFEDAAHHMVPLTFFKGFVTEKSGPHKGQMDLKESGLLFIVECARILALLHGVAEVGTIERVGELERLGVMPPDEGRLVRGAYGTFVRLLFKAQAARIRAGEEPDAYIAPLSIPMEERFLLRLALEASERLQTLVHAAIHTPFVAGIGSRAV